MPREEIKDGTGKVTITLDGDTGEALIGATLVDGAGTPGTVVVQNQAGQASAVLTGDDGKGACLVELRNSMGQNGIVLFPSAPPIASIISVHDEQKREIFAIQSGGGLEGNARLFVGEPGAAAGGKAGRIEVFDQGGHASIVLNGLSGDIFLRNADCAEDFEVLGAEEIEPGMVMVIDGDGRLRPSGEAYDRKVAGVVSGAGDLRPGLVLGRQPHSAGRTVPVALAGRVFCKVDARHSPITVGDLLCTSPLPGHAMAALDPQRAFGAVLGKALRPLAAGLGLIPVLVALQ
jgi:hypothetical protein